MYSNLSAHSFWKNCRESDDFLGQSIYAPKFELKPGTRVATAGSCFAQRIGEYIRYSKLELVDTEPAPKLMRPNVAKKYGFGLYSARYGNVYTARQLFQLLTDCEDQHVRDAALWQDGDRWFDGLRPNVEPEGFDSAGEVREMRKDHLLRVRQIFEQTDVFVFTLGLTEAWRDKRCGTVFPTAPGTVAGTFDSETHEFVNFGVADCLEDMSRAISLIKSFAPDIKIILTVSPVPLTATATGQHVLRATTYSKSVLRVVAEELATSDSAVDYFPSYELITGTPFGGQFYESNLRNVTPKGVEFVMGSFFAAHKGLIEAKGKIAKPISGIAEQDGVTSAEPYSEDVCEEALLEAFAPK